MSLSGKRESLKLFFCTLPRLLDFIHSLPCSCSDIFRHLNLFKSWQILSFRFLKHWRHHPAAEKAQSRQHLATVLSALACMLQQKDYLTQRWKYWQTGKYLPELKEVHLFTRYSVLYAGKPNWSNTPATLHLLLQQKPNAAWKAWMSTFQKLKENWFWIKMINWFPSWPSWELNLSTQLSCIKIFSEAIKAFYL